MTTVAWRYRTNWRGKVILQYGYTGWHPYYGSGYWYWRDAKLSNLLVFNIPPKEDGE